jgi:hypothetical protein
MMRQVGVCDQGPIDGRSGTESCPALPDHLTDMGVSKMHSVEALLIVLCHSEAALPSRVATIVPSSPPGQPHCKTYLETCPRWKFKPNFDTLEVCTARKVNKH